MNDNSCTRQSGFNLPRMPRVTCRVIVVLLLAASLSVIVQGCTPQGGTPQPGISLEALVDAFNNHDPVALDTLIAADVLRHGPPGPPISSPGMPQGRDVIKGEWAAIWSAFPDAVMRIDTRIMDGDRLHAHYTVTGTHRGPFYGVMPTGAPAVLRLSESYRIDEGKIAEIWTVTDTFSTIQSLTLPMPAPAPLAPLRSTVLASFRPGRFMESIAIDADGVIYVSSMFEGEILRVAADGSSEVFANVPFGEMEGFKRGVVCLVFDHERGLNVVVSSRDPAVHGIWRYDRDGNGSRRAALPPESAPNGITIDRNGDLYVADSVYGTVWRVRKDATEATAWVSNPVIAPRPYIGMFPGANGIKIFDRAVYTVVSDTGRFVRIPIQDDGRPGLPEVMAEGLPGDDFAFDVHGNVYMTTHPYNTVVRYAPDGSRAVVASVEQHVVGPTSAAFGTLPGDEGSLYVLSDGGLANPLPGQELQPNIVRLEVGIAGNPIVR